MSFSRPAAPKTTASAGIRGREEGPVEARCEVLRRSREGDYHVLTLSAPEIARRAHPGQFVEIATQAQLAILRRPFSIYRVSQRGAASGTVEVVFDAHGPGTEWLAGVQLHTMVDVVGPLGSPFPLPRERVPCLLIGGGYGIAPLFFLSERLAAEGHRIDMIVGAATHDRLFNPIEAKRTTASVTFTTEDGSYGVEGIVTDVIDDVATSAGSGVTYACGPMPMLRAVAEESRRLGMPCQVAVEEHMACGVGVCWTCVVPVRLRRRDDEDEPSVRMKRACIDGPVFNATHIAWEASRWGSSPTEDGEGDDDTDPDGTDETDDMDTDDTDRDESSPPADAGVTSPWEEGGDER